MWLIGQNMKKQSINETNFFFPVPFEIVNPESTLMLLLISHSLKKISKKKLIPKFQNFPLG